MEALRLGSSVRDLKSCQFWVSLVAEFLGTFLLVFIGFGSAYNNMNPVKLGLGFGLAGVVIIFCIGPISGGHINPAVSFGLLIAREISLAKFIIFSFIQIIGATAGFGMIYGVSGKGLLHKSFLKFSLNASANSFVRIDEVIHRVDNPTFKILCEMVITFMLVFTVMTLCVEKKRTPTEKGLASLIIGLSIAAGVFCGMNISGGSMNPAASLGKYFFAGSRTIWTHIIGPFSGGAIAGLLYQLLFTSQLSKSHIRSYLFDRDFVSFPSSGAYSESNKDEQLTEKL